MGKKKAHWTEPATTAMRVSTSVENIDPSAKPGFVGKKKAGRALRKERGEHLADLQEKLFANGRSGDKRSVLLVLQGMDTAGKGGMVRHVLGMVDPQGIDHAAFGVPSEEEKKHSFLWRIEKQLPTAGRIGVFDRSHYEDVLAVRVHDLAPREVWEPRYDDINEFEKRIVESGTTIIKVAMFVSLDEQKQRLAKRLRREDKYWKYNPADVTERAFWPKFQQAYQAVLDRTDTEWAPWFIVPCDRKWFSRLTVTELLISALESLDLDWPPADFDIDVEKKRLAES